MQNSVANLMNYYPVKEGEATKYEIFGNTFGKAILIVFDSHTGLPEHKAPSDATVQIVEGEVEFMLDNLRMRLHQGDVINMRKGTLHSVEVPHGARILLTLFG